MCAFFFPFAGKRGKPPGKNNLPFIGGFCFGQGCGGTFFPSDPESW